MKSSLLAETVLSLRSWCGFIYKRGRIRYEGSGVEKPLSRVERDR
jgi:hypothetical protein